MPYKSISRRGFLGRSIRGACALGAAPLVAGCGDAPDVAALPKPILPKPMLRRHKDAPTIILITLDTTRADHLGCYGYYRPTSPNLDHLAEQSLVYDHAIAPATWTLPSHASLFTGKFVSSHGAQYDANGTIRLSDAQMGPGYWNQFSVRTIAPSEITMAELLREAGYATAGIVSGPVLKPVFGLSKGFESYDDNNITTKNGRPADDVTNTALNWLRKTAGQPQFLFLNYFDPHDPWLPPDQFARRFVAGGTPAPDEGYSSREQIFGLYDAEILYMDHHLGRLLQGLKELKLFENAWIIITADHGELLGEHKLFHHGHYPYQEVVHVPLIVKEPGGTNRTKGHDTHWTQLTDLLPMMLDRLHITKPDQIQGQVPPNIDHSIVIESFAMPPDEHHGRWRAIIDGTMKYIWHSNGGDMLFDLSKDPGEQNNLIAQQPQNAETMKESLTAYLASLPAPAEQSPGGELDRETVKALKGLGYVK